MVTGSKIMGNNVATILDFFGIRYSKTYCYNRKWSNTKFTKILICNRPDIFRIGGDKIHPFVAKDRCTQYIHTDGVLIPIKSIKKLPYKGKVYNIDVNTIHRYIVDGMLVNNCRWYGGFQSYVVASEFHCPIFVPSMHCKQKGEEGVPNLTHIPYMMWNEWMQHLSTYRYAVHLMPAVAAGTFSLNCACLGIPCIGNEKIDTQSVLFPDLSVDVNDIHQSRFLAIRLREDKEFYNQVSNHAKIHAYNSWYANPDQWLKLMEESLNE